MSKTTSLKPQQQDPLTLDSVLQEMQEWRSKKTHPKQSIPDKLWRKIFDLADVHSSTTVRKVFALNSKQYRIKYEQLCTPSAPI